MTLISGLINKDEKQINIFVRKYSNIIANFIHNKFKWFRINNEDILEITQDSLLRAYDKINLYDKNKKFLNWLFEISKNVTFDWYKKHKKEFNNNMSDCFDFNLEQYKILDFKQNNEKEEVKIENENDYIICLNEGFKQMSDYEKELINLRLNDFPYKDLAEKFNKKENAVKTSHFRALKKLKKICNDLYLKRTNINEVING